MTIMPKVRLGALAVALAAAVACSASPVVAQAGGERQQITLNVAAPEQGEQFACGIPVSVSHAEDLELTQLTVIAKVYHGNIELASTGIKANGRPLIRDRDQLRVEYAPVPLQFDLTEEACERITGLGVAFASCTLADGEQENCLDRLRFEPEKAGSIAFFVGEPKPPAR